MFGYKTVRNFVINQRIFETN